MIKIEQLKYCSTLQYDQYFISETQIVPMMPDQLAPVFALVLVEVEAFSSGLTAPIKQSLSLSLSSLFVIPTLFSGLLLS